MNFKDYCRRVLNEETDIISVKAKLDAKKRGLKHQSHNVWKDKGGQEYKWNKMLKRFEKIENKRKEVKHFEFTDKTKKIKGGIVLKQIRAIKDLPYHNIKEGDVGGWIEKPENLSENAWISGDAWVSGDAQISGNAQVSENAWVSENAKVSGDAWVYGNAEVFGYARVSGNAKISENKIINTGEYK